MYGPRTPYAQELHAQKYRGKGESFREAMNRVAAALEDSPGHFADFREALLEMRFLPGGRVQRSVGSSSHVTPYNCYVSGRIADSFVEGEGSIMQRVTEAAATLRMGGGIGYDFSTLRPRGAVIKKLGSHSTGPVSFMELFDALCSCVSSAGHRRGAQMGVLRVDHPDIEEFIKVKQTPPQVTNLWSMAQDTEDPQLRQALLQELQYTLRLRGFNLSVAVTDEFMECLLSGKPFKLRFGGEVYREVDAESLWDAIMRGTWDWAEPGVLFIDTINRMNNTRYCEEIVATNPCGEQPLPPFGGCLLGSFNLTRYLTRREPYRTAGWDFDWDQFKYDIPVVVRAMDKVPDQACFPLEEQARVIQQTRRMGLGVTGLANTLEALGFRYGSPGFLEQEAKLLDTLRDESYRASIQLARERGPFPAFDRERYLESPFIQGLPDEIRDGIEHYGIRNSHLTSIAPTGTISLTADNVSSSIEPPFMMEGQRVLIGPGGPEVVTVYDYGDKFLGVRGEVCDNLTVEEHLAVFLVASRRVDSAVSKTCNVGAAVSWAEFKHIYVRAWEGGAKGVTTFRMDGKKFGLVRPKKSEGEACSVDESGRRNCE